MEDEGHHRGDHDGDEGPVDQKLNEGQLEGIKTDVLRELGVLYSELDAVAEEEPVVPLRSGADTREQGKDGGNDQTNLAGMGANRLAVALNQLVLRPNRSESGGDAV